MIEIPACAGMTGRDNLNTRITLIILKYNLRKFSSAYVFFKSPQSHCF